MTKTKPQTNQTLVEEWIKKNGVTRLTPNKAKGVPEPGYSCAGPCSTNLMAKAAGIGANKDAFFEDHKKMHNNRKKLQEAKKKNKKEVTQKQKNLILELGGTIPNRCTIPKAHGIIQNLLRLKKEQEKNKRLRNNK